MIKKLEEIRRRTQELKRLEDEYAAMLPGARSPRLTGMPRGGGGAGIEWMVDARTEMEGQIRAQEEALGELKAQVMPRIRALDAKLFTFCLHYFFSAMSVREVCAVIGKTEKTFYEYKKKLREMQKSEGDVRGA